MLLAIPPLSTTSLPPLLTVAALAEPNTSCSPPARIAPLSLPPALEIGP
jgi:hypothetical protein